MSKLLPCPFCGSSVLASAGLYSLYCQRCGAEGPDADAHERDAVHAAWNRRSKPAQQAAPTDAEWPAPHSVATVRDANGRARRGSDLYTREAVEEIIAIELGKLRYAPAQDAERERDAERYMTVRSGTSDIYVCNIIAGELVIATGETCDLIVDAARAQRAASLGSNIKPELDDAEN